MRNINFDAGITGNNSTLASSQVGSDIQELLNRKVDKVDFKQFTHLTPRKKDLDKVFEQLKNLFTHFKSFVNILM